MKLLTNYYTFNYFLVQFVIAISKDFAVYARNDF